ncbi:TonB-dependent siderophore receptor [Pseudomonas sp. 3JA]|uniref:TonB-dependent siderophore receptor n=1 Tax=Pseudomonas sp. 3JA TaxID=3109347 RepID=UPI0030083F70
MSNRFNTTRRLTSVCFSVLLAQGYASTSFAESVSTQSQSLQNFDLPADSLVATLDRIARQSGHEIVYVPNLVAGLRAPAIKGTMNAERAAQIAIEGSGLSVRTTSDGTLTLDALGSMTLPAQSIVGMQTEAPTVSVGTKVPLRLREVPQTINVIGQERIQKQNLYTLEDALGKVGGVTVQRIDASRLSFFSRGFEMTSLQLDGTPTTMDNRVFLSPDLTMYDRVEVLKGPSGSLTGAGGPGGSINLIRKRPLAEAAASAEISAGSWDDYRGMVDVTGPLTESGNVRGRLVLSEHDEGYYYDSGGKRESNQVYGIVDIDLTPDTVWTIGASNQNTDIRGAQRSLPAYRYTNSAGEAAMSLPNASRKNFYGEDWNRDYFWSTAVFTELEHQLGDGWKTRLSLRHADNNYDLTQAYARNGGGIDPADNLVSMNSIMFDYREKQDEADVYVDGPFNFLGREHTVLVGANYSRSEFASNGGYFSNFLGDVDLVNPQPDFAYPAFPDSDKLPTSVANTRAKALYSNMRLSLSDPLTLVLGGRVTWLEMHRSQHQPEAGSPSEKSGDSVSQKFTPFYGLIYDLNDNYSVYANYSGVFQPQAVSNLDINNNIIKPLEGKQHELGIKGEFLDGALNASLAAFQIEEENRAIPDMNDPNARAVVASGKARTRGFEAELSGQMTPDWFLSANFTHTYKRYDSPNEQLQTYLPKNMLRVWSLYKLPGELEKWSVQGGVSVVSETYNKLDVPGIGMNGTKLRQGGYALYDAGIGYQITQNFSADLLGTNLTDKKYFQRINTFQDGNIFGDPRAVSMTLRAKF